MTRNGKNVICILLLLITCGLVYFTMTKVNSGNKNGGIPNNMGEKGNNMGEPPS